MKNNPVIKVVSLGALQLEYYVYGNGPETVICLHGHGRHASDFSFLHDDKRKVISLHLFFHGHSYFPVERIENDPLKYSEVKDIFDKLLETESVDTFHLFAFSQGGRFSLCLLPDFVSRIKSFTLISPDGMDNYSFYNWSSRQKWARWLMKNWESDPKRLYKVSKFGEKLHLVRPKVVSFVKEFTSTKKTFQRASQTWRCFRNLLPDPIIVGKSINEHRIPFLIIMGKYDQVIRPKQAENFVKRCGLKGHIAIIDSGHNFFKESTINKFLHLLPFL